MKTGVVVTSRLTHATPASFTSHVIDRNMESEIARQQIESGTDIMLGGGYSFFIPQSMEGSSRDDDLNIIEMANQKGYNVLTEKSQLETTEFLFFIFYFYFYFYFF